MHPTLIVATVLLVVGISLVIFDKWLGIRQQKYDVGVVKYFRKAGKYMIVLAIFLAFIWFYLEKLVNI